MTREIDFIRDKCEWEAEVEAMQDDTIVTRCDNCGEPIYNWENDTLAVISEDGLRANVYCQYCTGKSLRFVEDVLEAAGLWYMHGWADDVNDCANSEVTRRILAKRMKGVSNGQRAF